MLIGFEPRENWMGNIIIFLDYVIHKVRCKLKHRKVILFNIYINFIYSPVLLLKVNVFT